MSSAISGSYRQQSPAQWAVGLVLIALLATACATQNPATKTVGIDRKATAASVKQQLMANQVKAEWLDIRANVDYSGPDRSIGGDAIIKIRRDSVIWVSVRKFGFEGARALVTVDSVFIIDRLNNEYSAEPLSYLEEKFKLPARFDLLQQLIMGNPIFFTDALQLEQQDNRYQLIGTTDRWNTRYAVDPATYHLRQVRIDERSNGRSIDLQLDDYQPVADGKTYFSYLRTITANTGEGDPSRIELAFTKVVLNEPTEIRFEIPERYTRQ